MQAFTACVLFCLYIFGTLGVSVLHALDHDRHDEICRAATSDSCCRHEPLPAIDDLGIGIPEPQSDSKITHSCLLCHLHLQFDQACENTFTESFSEPVVCYFRLFEPEICIFDLFEDNLSRGPPCSFSA